MPAGYSAKELVDIAIGIERRGIIYYDVIARSTENDQARAVFEGLSRMERVHLATFEHMLDDIGGVKAGEGEEEGYITRTRTGRANIYEINNHVALRNNLTRKSAVKDLLQLIND